VAKAGKQGQLGPFSLVLLLCVTRPRKDVRHIRTQGVLGASVTGAVMGTVLVQGVLCCDLLSDLG